MDLPTASDHFVRGTTSTSYTATMDPTTQRNHRGLRTNGHAESGSSGRRVHHGNKRWVADGVTGRSGATTPHTGSDNERWERGGHRGGGRGRGRSGRGRGGNATVTLRRNGALDGATTGSEGEHSEVEEEYENEELDPNEPETPEDREKFWQELVRAREVERRKAIAQGKMDDPLKPKRLEDAINMVGTCMDMCPRFERYRRERENNLFEWETVPGTKRVDHKRAVKAYERAAGDKILPSDLRPPDVLKHTLDYLFHELLPLGGFSETFNFIRDRSRAVRNDFTMQHEMGPIAIECHDRCARFHILALHIERDHPGFSITLEEQQLMNTLQSLKESYQDQRGHYQSPTELEMRVYHRLVHIRDQRERHDDIPQALLNHPVFELTTKFRARVQAQSAPISKASHLVVDSEAMQIFAELADVLRRKGNVVMTYLVACILERHFGKDTIEDIESIRGDLSLSDIIDGYTGMDPQAQDTDIDVSAMDESQTQAEPPHIPHRSPESAPASGFRWPSDPFGLEPQQSAFLKPTTTDPPSQPFVTPAQSVFANLKTVPNAFGTASFGIQSAFTHAAPAPPSVPVFRSMKDNNAVSSGSFQLKSAVDPPQPTSASSFPSFSSAPAATQKTMSMLQAEQASQMTSLFSQEPQVVGEFPFAAPKKSETSGPTLRPLAPTVAPMPSFSGKSNFGATASSTFNIAPSAGIHSPIKIRKPTLSESSAPIPQQPLRETSTSNTTISEIPFVSSPPSMDTAPLESTSQPTPPQPPPLSRLKPISLPPTPTATMFAASPLPETRKSVFRSLRNIQTTPLSAAPTEILSPLVLHPITPRSMSWISGMSRRESMQSPLKAVVSAADIAAEAKPPTEEPSTSVAARPPSPIKKPSLDIMKATALHFARRGWLVKEAFSRWRQRLNEHAKWIEACRRSTIYKEKARAERLSRSVGSSPSAHSRVHHMTQSETRVPLKKRLRERLSGEYRPPVNDEELALRFEKNHQEHAQRWARGSFLHVLQDFVESARSPVPDNWCAWLSLNQESDGTAIWLEQKFNVPDSGKWKNELVFQIPMSKTHAELSCSYPGVILFERTPLTGMTDILERKYHVLEDCTRLREITEALPDDRHYVPSLLCIAWSERDPDSSKDFDDMIGSMVDGGMFTSTHELVISSAVLDMESKLEVLLHDIPFDLDGRLVKRVSLNDLFEEWEYRHWKETIAEWLGDCHLYGEFNWDLYAKLLEGCTRLLIQIIDSVVSLLRDHGVANDIPQLQLARGMDSVATFDAVLNWLRALPDIDAAASLVDDIRAHQNLGRDFPTMTFPSQLYALGRPLAAHVADVDGVTVHFVSRSRLDVTSKEIERLKTSLEGEIKTCRIDKCKPLKRLASFAEPSMDPARTSTPRSKKQRVSLSEDEATPSPSLSTATFAPPEPTIVTSVMLRSLTKDIRAKYQTSR